MHPCIAPKIVIRVFTVLTLSAGFVHPTVSGGRYGINTGSAFGMESVPGAVATGSQLAHDPGSRSLYPVKTLLFVQAWLARATCVTILKTGPRAIELAIR